MSPFAGRAPLGLQTLKDALFTAAKRMGAFALVRDSEWRRQHLLILCYHGVSLRDEHEWNGALYVAPELLRMRLRYLREGPGYAILPLDEACRLLRERRLPPRSVALTFDDASVDFGVAALPILREFGAPATLYLSSYYTSVRLPVFDPMLSYVLWKGRESGAEIAAFCGSVTPLPVASQPQRDRAYQAVCAHAVTASLDALAKDALVARIASHLGVNYDEIRSSGVLQLMTPESVAALPAEISVQLHTHRHRTPRNKELFRRELVENASRIREMRGASAELSHFSYPSGDYRGDMLPWLREFGVRYATTCVPGIASPEDDPLLLPRFVDSSGGSMTTFEAWTTGFAAWLPRRQQHRLNLRRLATDPSGEHSDPA